MEKIKVHDKTFKLYMSESEIRAAVQRVADEISRDYVNRSPILCPVLTGSYMFAADLSRCMTIDAPLSFVRYSSYEGMASSGQVKKSLGFSEACRVATSSLSRISSTAASLCSTSFRSFASLSPPA